MTGWLDGCFGIQILGIKNTSYDVNPPSLKELRRDRLQTDTILREYVRS